MTETKMNGYSPRLLQMLVESTGRSSTLHRQFLQYRANALQQMKALIALQISGSGGAQAAPGWLARPALFSSQQLDEFGTGQISKCLGPAFARYEGRRIPRIPNGDLKMMSRIVSVEGRPLDFNHPASLVAEYDVPTDAWYLRDHAAPQVPFSLWMEIALQPCGFLSAYLDTYALAPDNEFYFRNLDGRLQILSDMDVRGQTVTTRARLVSSIASNGTIVQKYAFELSCGGRLVVAGDSVFGYFSQAAMTNQVGLDGGRPVQPWLRAGGAGKPFREIDPRGWQAGTAQNPDLHLGRGRLGFLDRVSVALEGGQYGKGYVYASRAVDPQDWFFPYHFYQDPVMPGSLGVEAILQAMQAFALAAGVEQGLRNPRFETPAGTLPAAWRYRGQITPQNRQIELEAHLKGSEIRAGRVILVGDASLWVDGLRIYEIKNAAIGIREG